MAFAESFRVSWAHLDGNGHMANTSYMLMAIDCRFHYFASRGLGPGEFGRLRIGPVVRNDSIDYYRELQLLQEVRVELRCASGGARAGPARPRAHAGLRGAALQRQVAGGVRSARRCRP